MISSGYRSSVAFVNSTWTGPAAISARKPALRTAVYSNENERRSFVRTSSTISAGPLVSHRKPGSAVTESDSVVPGST